MILMLHIKWPFTASKLTLWTNTPKINVNFFRNKWMFEVLLTWHFFPLKSTVSVLSYIHVVQWGQITKILSVLVHLLSVWFGVRLTCRLKHQECCRDSASKQSCLLISSTAQKHFHAFWWNSAGGQSGVTLTIHSNLASIHPGRQGQCHDLLVKKQKLWFLQVWPVLSAYRRYHISCPIWPLTSFSRSVRSKW